MATADLPPTAHLPFESKRKLLAVLARDLLSTNPGRLSVADAMGELFIYTVPPNARANAERAIRESDPTALAELHHRASEESAVMTFEEVLALRPSKEDDSTPRS